MKKNKYGNKKTTREVNGQTQSFDSMKEARYFDELYLLAKQGIITELTLQPKYLLLDTLRVDGHKTMAKRHYNADFRYRDKDSNLIVVDVKSVITKANPVYTLKKHLFLAKYGHEIIFKEV